MEKQKEAKKYHDIFVDSINELDLKLKLQMKEIKKEYQNNIAQEKILLLHTICNGENLDFNTLKNKYLKSNEISQIFKIPIVQFAESVNDTILNKIEYDNNIYYYENKEDGDVYNTSSKLVGVFKNNNIVFKN
jgi:hypothetical protein